MRISKITSVQDYEWIKVKGGSFNEREKKMLDTYTVIIHYDHSYTWGDQKPEWTSYGSDPLERFLIRYSLVPNNDLDAYLKEVNQIISGEKSLEQYEDKSNIDAEGALIHMGSKEHLKILEQDLARRANQIEAVKQGVNLMMAKKMSELQKVRESLGLIVAEFEKKVEKIQKVIWTIELYLGIKEEIVQIQDGPAAPENTTIHFHQEKLYMDEEVGEPENGGLDFRSIDKFDEWLMQYSSFYKKYNYELMIPQQKGLMVFEVRRENKKYSDNPFVQAMMAEEDHKTYVLMRNGSKLYRIWGEIYIDKLFPNKEELSNMKEYWDWLDSQQNSDHTYLRIGEDDIPSKFKKYMRGHFSFQKVYENKEKLESKAFRYKQNFMMLQGLIDRTEVFYPIPERIQLMDSSAIEKGYVKFVYTNEERKLDDGRMSFEAWRNSLNDTLEVGNRIIYINEMKANNRYSYSSRTEEMQERLDHRFQSSNQWSIPSAPSTGIYSLEKYVSKTKGYAWRVANNIDELPDYERNCRSEDFWQEKGRFPWNYCLKNDNGSFKEEYKKEDHVAIYYNPEDTVTNWWNKWDCGHTRKNRLSFKIFLKEDWNIMNYDAIDLDDVIHYLYDRRHRASYLKRMPLLWNIKQRLESEQKQELEFVRGLVEDMKRKGEKIKNPKENIYEAINWWKTKNKWKRPISQDDEKAWKMIRKKLKLKT